MQANVRHHPAKQGFEVLMDYPFSQKRADGLDHWIYDVFSAGKNSKEEQSKLIQSHLSYLDQLGYENAFVLLATAKRLSHQFQRLSNTKTEDREGWQRAGKVFGQQLQAFIEKYPEEYQKSHSILCLANLLKRRCRSSF